MSRLRNALGDSATIDCRELLERGRIGIHCGERLSELVAHLVVDDEIVARSGDELGQRDLIVVIRVEPQLAPMETIWKDRLVEIGDR